MFDVTYNRPTGQRGLVRLQPVMVSTHRTRPGRACFPTLDVTSRPAVDHQGRRQAARSGVKPDRSPFVCAIRRGASVGKGGHNGASFRTAPPSCASPAPGRGRLVSHDPRSRSRSQGRASTVRGYGTGSVHTISVCDAGRGPVADDRSGPAGMIRHRPDPFRDVRTNSVTPSPMPGPV